MPLYEYECPVHGRFEKIELMRQPIDSDDSYIAFCPMPKCGQLSEAVISKTHWSMGWEFLKNKSEKSPPAPTDAGYHPEWDQAYAP